MAKRSDSLLPLCTRRRFLAGAVAAGALASLPGSLLGAPAGAKPRPRLEKRTFFFNFAHEPGHQRARYLLLVGGRRYRLVRVRSNPHVLRRHRRHNRFLQNVPDSQITHVIENLRLPADYVSLTYVGVATGGGTWTMSGMYLLPPSSGLATAAGIALEQAAGQGMPASAKRRLYGLNPAQSPQDVVEEAILLDPTEHATAIVGLHPDVLGLDGVSGARVQGSIQGNAGTLALATWLQALGPARPEETPGQPNADGWATLTPILDPNNQPYRNLQGKNKGWIQYHPVWQQKIRDTAQPVMGQIVQQVKGDETLGRDITGADPSQAGVTGILWKRHDGLTTVDQSPGAGLGDDAVKFTLVRNSTDSGFAVTATGKTVGGGFQATLTFTNWFVRWLGIYLLFLDEQGNPIDPKGVEIQLPPDYTNQADDTPALNQYSAMFAALLGPEFTVLGIPVAASTATVSFKIPTPARTVRVFASGPSFEVLGGVDPKDMETWCDWFPGMITTLIFNYALTTILMFAGACAELSAVQKAGLMWAVAIVKALPAGISNELRNQDFSGTDAWTAAAKAIAKSLFGSLLTKRMTTLWATIMGSIAVGEAEDCIPLIGQIAEAISVIAGAATEFETTVEIAESPVSYVYDLQWSYSPKLTIEYDKARNDQFPAEAAYYKVTAQFSNGGTPVVQTLAMPSGTVTSLPAVTLLNIPGGGDITVTVGFYSSGDDLLAKGSTGAVPNDSSTLPNLVIEEFPTPITARTTYQHVQKTVLDAQGNHGWLKTASPPEFSPFVCETAPGSLCALRGITVRQGTAKAPGYLGYAFQSSSSGVSACGSGNRGQLDQLVNLGTEDPQAGYATLGCGLLAGAHVSYSLLPGGNGTTGESTAGGSNFYLDSTSQSVPPPSEFKLVRAVRLNQNPPRFDPPSGGEAFGALSLESDALLLHPSGHLVSLNRALHKLEILKLPPQPLPDNQAGAKFRARTHAGLGTRPGLLSDPVAAAISPDGVVLVMESGNNRIQAFDIGANPARFFKHQSPPYFLELTATAGSVYLDLAVEYTGYLYVLSYSEGSDGRLYRLDIYNPAQQGSAPISTTYKVNGARLAVDFWRNVYTLNYEVLRLPGGGLPEVTEPSVSQWVAG